jgi:hypothetical protein
MKILTILFLFLLSTFTVNGKCDFYDKVLDDFQNNSYFLVIKVETPSYKGKVITENDNFVSFLYHIKGINEAKYKPFVKKLLLNDTPLKISDEELEKGRFFKILPIREINEFSSKGQEEFIKKYFDGRVIKEDLSKEERIAIIEKLFEWKIATNIGDITAEMVFTRFDQKNLNDCLPKQFEVV